ncbi:MAG: GNAT family N-acetyltransferase [Longimicrobiales bacterium]
MTQATLDPGSALSVRDGVAADASRVEAVHWASRNAAYQHVAGWPPEHPGLPERIDLWRQWLSHPGITCMVAESDGVIVGLCTLRACTDEDLDRSRIAEMPTLYVHPDAWSRGIGTRLCAAACERARAAGYEALVLWSIDSNTRSERFYTHFGFTREPVTKVVDWPHDTLTARRYRIELRQDATRPS